MRVRQSQPYHRRRALLLATVHRWYHEVGRHVLGECITLETDRCNSDARVEVRGKSFSDCLAKPSIGRSGQTALTLRGVQVPDWVRDYDLRA